jgi:hypothetical protein
MFCTNCFITRILNMIVWKLINVYRIETIILRINTGSTWNILHFGYLQKPRNVLNTIFPEYWDLLNFIQLLTKSFARYLFYAFYIYTSYLCVMEITTKDCRDNWQERKDNFVHKNSYKSLYWYTYLHSLNLTKCILIAVTSFMLKCTVFTHIIVPSFCPIFPPPPPPDFFPLTTWK